MSHLQPVSIVPVLTLNFMVHLLAFSTANAAVPSQYVKKPAEWFRTAEGRQIADNVIAWQSPEGSWPKNGDTASKPYKGEAKQLKGTFDNGATTGELRFLAAAFRATDEARYRDAFFKGFDALLQAQYPTGGWPQFYPPGREYHRHITFNDDTMVRILELMREIRDSSDYSFVDQKRRDAAKSAFDKGIECILKCQIVVKGKRTVWCAQHDEIDLRPRPARAYELESLSGSESASILKLLMSLKEPTPEIRQAIEAGVQWFEAAKITGLRVERKGGERLVIEDPKAPPLWARFYEIDTNRPFFCGRDGIKKYQLSEIEAERRNGYAWYGSWGKEVAESYQAWKKR